MEQVTGIEPASPAWKAGALAIVLHLHAPSAKIVSSVIIASVSRFVNVFSEFFCAFLCYLSRACKSLAPSALSGRVNAPHSRSGRAAPRRAPIFGFRGGKFIFLLTEPGYIWYHDKADDFAEGACGCSTMARAPAFQAGDAGSIPVTCSRFVPVAQLDRATAF